MIVIGSSTLDQNLLIMCQVEECADNINWADATNVAQIIQGHGSRLGFRVARLMV